MRAVLQRVLSASVAFEDEIIANIGRGLLVFVAAASDDSEEDIDWLARKIVALKLFAGDGGGAWQSVGEAGGEILLVSQFTLLASTRKGTRPSWHRAAPPETGRALYERFVARVEALLGRSVARGRFGGMMRVGLENDGPVTVIIDTKLRE